jgi:hypothetical protein
VRWADLTGTESRSSQAVPAKPWKTNAHSCQNMPSTMGRSHGNRLLKKPDQCKYVSGKAIYGIQCIPRMKDASPRALVAYQYTNEIIE